MSGSTTNSVYIGSGSDLITFDMAEEQAAGEDAQFTVNVDGQQIGGPQTVTASQAAGQTERFTFGGNYGPGAHSVTITFVNNFIYPGQPGDRNLYVDGVTYDGTTVSDTSTPIYNAPLAPPTSTVGELYGNAVYAVNDTTPIPAGASPNPTSSPGPVSVGSGADTLVLNMAEDAYQGDAQFTVSVDGQQIGGTQTTRAWFTQGQAQEFDIHGNFGAGTHTVTVDYLNDLVGGYYPAGTPGLPPGLWALDSEDRNLYVAGMSLDGGAPASGAPWELSSDGTANFTVTAGSNLSPTASGSGLFASDGAAATSGNPGLPTGTSGSSPSGSTSATPPPVPSAPSTPGMDSLTINAAGYAVQDVNPQFIAYVDGNQVGGVNTVTATEYDGTSTGGNQAFTFTGNWGSGPHTIGIDYINNNMSSSGDLANLFVNSIQFDGNTTVEYTQTGSVSAGFLYQNGTTDFNGIVTHS